MLNRQGLLDYASLPSIDILRGELVSILGSPAAKTRHCLSHHQHTLSTNLSQYISDSTNK